MSNEILHDQKVGWVSPPSGRSTSGILWSCSIVLLICSYKCVHMNIPSFEERHAKWYKWPAIRKNLRKLQWMIVLLIAPEYGVVTAVDEYLTARKAFKSAQAIAPQFEWSIVHGFYGIMGGFAYFDISTVSPLESAELLQGLPHMTREKLYSLTLSDYASFLCKTESSHNLFVTKESITDRSKSDTLTKLFAIVQCSWLVLGLVARERVGLPSTQLELATAAYVLCAIVIYSFWWHKPFDIDHVTILPGHNDDGVIHRWKRISLNGLAPVDDKLDWGLIAASTTAVLFSVVHLVAWNWKFPSSFASILWKIMSIVTTVIPISLTISFAIQWEWLDDIMDWVDMVCAGLYVIARIGLMVLIIYSLKSMPAAVYQSVTWTEIWPHFS